MKTKLVRYCQCGTVVKFSGNKSLGEEVMSSFNLHHPPDEMEHREVTAREAAAARRRKVEKDVI